MKYAAWSLFPMGSAGMAEFPWLAIAVIAMVTGMRGRWAFVAIAAFMCSPI